MKLIAMKQYTENTDTCVYSVGSGSPSRQHAGALLTHEVVGGTTTIIIIIILDVPAAVPISSSLRLLFDVTSSSSTSPSLDECLL
ncbi:Holliday junction ATP-dependent DNA helicase RuvA [Frankliniella fusca]|uniref:Holliday junction ATP-dependent DNA helicase RuvA n=1 Tax=Frankliniella fusca TaxID=407009 RepID=A0AAE1LVP4_9NEOP|nr:Holliday junction ATP-dependent DNA helicase RuvA [Frankliniella fusca]